MQPKPLLLTIFLLLPSLAAAQKPAQRPAITGISHLTLYAGNIPKSRDFYTSLLGWQPVPATGNQPGIRFYANHAQYVELIAPPTPNQPVRLDSVAFATANAEALRLYLAAHSVQVPAKVTQEPNGDQSFQVRDPEGNKVGFVQQGNHPPSAPKSAPVSNHIMHAGYLVRDRAKLDHFYKDILGFHLYWQGGNPSTQTNWVMMQTPEGTDWIEYMLLLPASPSREQLGSANHLAPGVTSVAELQKALEQRGWHPANSKDTKILGVDGKMQLDLHDPDGTRVEFMEFAPVQTPCCSPYTGKQPAASTAW
jgi:catechol 2,3-dioxygenase-like lactoylglutathione lyase family enzyme